MRKYIVELSVSLVNYVEGVPQLEKVQAIKALREVTGLGLKESKDICDSLEGVGALEMWSTNSVKLIMNEAQLGRATVIRYRKYKGNDFCRIWIEDVQDYNPPPHTDVSNNELR